jgi:hypothetical protein
MRRQPKTDRVFDHSSSVVLDSVLIGQSVDAALGPASHQHQQQSINQCRVLTTAQHQHPTPEPARTRQGLPEPGDLFLFASTDSTAVCLETSALNLDAQQMAAQSRLN